MEDPTYDPTYDPITKRYTMHDIGIDHHSCGSHYFTPEALEALRALELSGPPHGRGLEPFRFAMATQMELFDESTPSIIF